MTTDVGVSVSEDCCSLTIEKCTCYTSMYTKSKCNTVLVSLYLGEREGALIRFGGGARTFSDLKKDILLSQLPSRKYSVSPG